MAISKAREIYEGVKGWIDKVIDLFNQIVSAAQRAIDKAREAFSAGMNAGKRQFGGPVSAASNYVVGEAGAEGFTPQTAGYITPHGAYAPIGMKGGGGGPTIQFIINADMIINSPAERRGLAEAIYADLVTLARSQNMTVAEMMGG
jgi:phage-related minor tail protein